MEKTWATFQFLAVTFNALIHKIKSNQFHYCLENSRLYRGYYQGCARGFGLRRYLFWWFWCPFSISQCPIPPSSFLEIFFQSLIFFFFVASIFPRNYLVRCLRKLQRLCTSCIYLAQAKVDKTWQKFMELDKSWQNLLKVSTWQNLTINFF